MKKRIVVFLTLLSLGLSACAGRRTVEYRTDREVAAVSTEDEQNEAEEEKEMPKKEEEACVPEKEEEALSVFIDISGEVQQPGVYELPAGNRIFHAIVAAGGFTDRAEIRCVNQADLLVDGEKIYIYSRDEADELGGWMQLSGAEPAKMQKSGGNGNSSQAESDGKVNINLADKSQLMTITGVGEARAEAILSYRESSGGFSAVEDIMKVSGIKEKLFEQIKDQITV